MTDPLDLDAIEDAARIGQERNALAARIEAAVAEARAENDDAEAVIELMLRALSGATEPAEGKLGLFDAMSDWHERRLAERALAARIEAADGILEAHRWLVNDLRLRSDVKPDLLRAIDDARAALSGATEPADPETTP